MSRLDDAAAEYRAANAAVAAAGVELELAMLRRGAAERDVEAADLRDTAARDRLLTARSALEDAALEVAQ